MNDSIGDDDRRQKPPETQVSGSSSTNRHADLKVDWDAIVEVPTTRDSTKNKNLAPGNDGSVLPKTEKRELPVTDSSSEGNNAPKGYEASNHLKATTRWSKDGPVPAAMGGDEKTAPTPLANAQDGKIVLYRHSPVQSEQPTVRADAAPAAQQEQFKVSPGDGHRTEIQGQTSANSVAPTPWSGSGAAKSVGRATEQTKRLANHENREAANPEKHYGSVKSDGVQEPPRSVSKVQPTEKNSQTPKVQGSNDQPTLMQQRKEIPPGSSGESQKVLLRQASDSPSVKPHTSPGEHQISSGKPQVNPGEPTKLVRSDVARADVARMDEQRLPGEQKVRSEKTVAEKPATDKQIADKQVGDKPLVDQIRSDIQKSKVAEAGLPGAMHPEIPRSEGETKTASAVPFAGKPDLEHPTKSSVDPKDPDVLIGDRKGKLPLGGPGTRFPSPDDIFDDLGGKKTGKGKEPTIDGEKDNKGVKGSKDGGTKSGDAKVGDEKAESGKGLKDPQGRIDAKGAKEVGSKGDNEIGTKRQDGRVQPGELSDGREPSRSPKGIDGRSQGSQGIGGGRNADSDTTRTSKTDSTRTTKGDSTKSDATKGDQTKTDKGDKVADKIETAKSRFDDAQNKIREILKGKEVRPDEGATKEATAEPGRGAGKPSTQDTGTSGPKDGKFGGKNIGDGKDIGSGKGVGSDKGINTGKGGDVTDGAMIPGVNVRLPDLGIKWGPGKAGAGAGSEKPTKGEPTGKSGIVASSETGDTKTSGDTKKDSGSKKDSSPDTVKESGKDSGKGAEKRPGKDSGKGEGKDAGKDAKAPSDAPVFGGLKETKDAFGGRLPTIKMTYPGAKDDVKGGAQEPVPGKSTEVGQGKSTPQPTDGGSFKPEGTFKPDGTRGNAADTFVPLKGGIASDVGTKGNVDTTKITARTEIDQTKTTTAPEGSSSKPKDTTKLASNQEPKDVKPTREFTPHAKGVTAGGVDRRSDKLDPNDPILQNAHLIPDDKPVARSIRDVFIKFKIPITKRDLKPEISESGTYRVQRGQSSQRLKALMSSSRLTIISAKMDSSAVLPTVQSSEELTTSTTQGSTQANRLDASESPAKTHEEPRKRHIVKEGEDVKFIASVYFNDESLADLVKEINLPMFQKVYDVALQQHVEVLPVGAMILLPNPTDIEAYRARTLG